MSNPNLNAMYQQSNAGPIRAAKAKTHFFKHTDLSVVLDAASADHGEFTGTKIMATMGPSIHDVDIVSKLLEAGLVAARVDLTWGPLEFHRKSISILKAAMAQTRRLAATVINTMGREVMVKGQWQANDQGYPWVLGKNCVTAGQVLTLTTREDAVVSDSVLPLSYSQFHQMAQPGDTIYIARYLISGAESSSLYLHVQDVVGQDVVCVAQNDAVLEGLLTVFHAERSEGAQLANVQNDQPLLSEWDKACITALGSEFEVDVVNLSYVRCGADVREARSFLDSVGMHHTKLFAKVETRQSLLNFEGILAEADGIIVSRGNLGLDCEPEKMALVQKTLIQACNLVGKPVLITRVVDTMVSTPRPTRAEATDVANAVLDGVDGILLGAETLRGKYPLETVQTVASICRAAEAVFDHSSHYEYLMDAAWEAVQSVQDTKDRVRSEGGEGDDSSLAAQMVSKGRLADNPKSPLSTAIATMAKFSQFGSFAHLQAPEDSDDDDDEEEAEGGANPRKRTRTPYLSKLESIASSAVRAADKVSASLIVVYTHTGQTAELVAKYRPPMPIMTLVIPHLISDGLRWKLEGSAYARHCLLSRGLLPVLSTPSQTGEALLVGAITKASEQGLVKPGDHVVVVQRVGEDFCVKIVSVDAKGLGILNQEVY